MRRLTLYQKVKSSLNQWNRLHLHQRLQQRPPTLEDSLKRPLLMCPLSSHSLNRRLSRTLHLPQVTSILQVMIRLSNNNLSRINSNNNNSNFLVWMSCLQIR